jgi:two-component system, cell cycle response regulator
MVTRSIPGWWGIFAFFRTSDPVRVNPIGRLYDTKISLVSMGHLHPRGVRMVRPKLEDVVSCLTLPSLPDVAAEIIELASDPNVSMKKIAQCVQKDQALAGKLLKTVNSSYYGLAVPCGSIERAVAFLGLNTVKSLVLGFSLVDVTRLSGAGGFDLMAHWRRAIVGGVSSRHVAVLTRSADPDLAFMAALFQDIGALACFVALKDRYSTTIEGRDHADWTTAEWCSLGFTHAEVGAELARKWKLPEAIRVAVLHHHAPDRAEAEYQRLVRVVALGSLVCSVLTQESPIPPVQQIQKLSRLWFQKDAPNCIQLIEQAATDAKQIAKIFSQDIGQLYNPGELMALAQEKGLEHQFEVQRETESLRKEASTDPLTGLANRRTFDDALDRAFADYVRGDGPLAVIFCDADRFKSINDNQGHAAGDAVLIQLARRLKATIGSTGLVARYGGEEIAIVLPNTGTDRAAALGEQIREAIAREPIDLAGIDCPADLLTMTISVGVAATDAEVHGHYDTAEKLLHDADIGVYKAKRAGRNRVIVHTRHAQREATSAEPTQTTTGTVRVLLVEDDPLAAMLIITLLRRHKDVEIQCIESGNHALTEIGKMDAGETTPADVFLAELNLPGTGGYELLRTVRGSNKLRDKTFIVLSGGEETGAKAECLRIGASGFVPKQEFIIDIGKWVGMIIGGESKAA